MSTQSSSNSDSIRNPKVDWYTSQVESGCMHAATGINLSYLDGYLAGMEFARRAHAEALAAHFGRAPKLGSRS